MTMRMLIDARHREETRVAVVKGTGSRSLISSLPSESSSKGNIYLAKVTRVEPSLQAAFVDYGGNRHGFLAFRKSTPIITRSPRRIATRCSAKRPSTPPRKPRCARRTTATTTDHEGEDGVEVLERPHDDEDHEEDAEGDAGEGEEASDDGRGRGRGRRRGRGGKEDEAEALRQRRMNLRRRYKIQDVIRRRQVLLVQVVKEERGNKGAALTTYLSLAGRYCVLMPNTAHGGGISRKISSAADRKRLKTIMSDLKLPPTMGCIVRTAGLQRTKTEIKRDFDYLARLWDGIREETLKSSAPGAGLWRQRSAQARDPRHL
jgi:ribonuclease E